jgi:hypothetical protein
MSQKREKPHFSRICFEFIQTGGIGHRGWRWADGKPVNAVEEQVAVAA